LNCRTNKRKTHLVKIFPG